MSEFRFNISLSVLNHLGRNLYRNFITVLGEAISNSWDAEAKNVHINIDREKNFLVIKDDGVGMDSSDFQNKFLRIGYSKRKEGATATESGRPYIGRKGIGKLALLSCAKTIHIASKKKNHKIIGGVIDNSGLDIAIQDGLTPQEYLLGSFDKKKFEKYFDNFEQGTAIYFENLNDGIFNTIPYLKKLIALYFRFSLIDTSFNIYLNEELITLDELDELSFNTQFVWQINSCRDPYLTDKLSLSRENIKRNKKIKFSNNIFGFIATVNKPSALKIRGTNEKVTLDLYVNGRLRERDLLKRIPTSRIVESYLYGQIHYNALDDEEDRFTSSREGIKSDDPLYQALLDELQKNIQEIIKEWDKWRIEINEDGDPDNTENLTLKKRKAKELANIITNEYKPPKSSSLSNKVDEWINILSKESQFNITSYAECFISENLLRKYIQYKEIQLSKKAKNESNRLKDRENASKGQANISFSLRQDETDLFYLDMDCLARTIEFVDKIKEAGLNRDAKEYKPIRDAMAHTSLLTKNAKNRLNLTYENIKARIITLLDE